MIYFSFFWINRVVVHNEIKLHDKSSPKDMSACVIITEANVACWVSFSLALGSS
jgi:hypothetical protein